MRYLLIMSDTTRLVIIKRIICYTDRLGDTWIAQRVLNSLCNPKISELFRDLTRDYDVYDSVNDEYEYAISSNRKSVLENMITCCWNDIIYPVHFSYSPNSYETLTCGKKQSQIYCGLHNHISYTHTNYICCFNTLIKLLFSGRSSRGHISDDDTYHIDNFDLALNNNRVLFNVSYFVILDHFVTQMTLDCDIAQTIKNILIELVLFPVEELQI